ncbi:MAG: hypothetical protein CMK32_06905 [Porticoccaceae bacterium]|nr:hypothetical protein [Porticoccaceae bacterium]
MLSKWRWLLSQLTRTLWVRAALFAVLGVLTALLGIVADAFWPNSLAYNIGADAVDGILNILATSMLAVTTFSLNVMVAAYSAATATVSPRATRLLRQDTTTQTVLATFIGSFLYSLVGIIALSTEIYSQTGRQVLFLATLVVIAIIVLTLLRWVEHLSRLGRVGETTGRVEEITTKTMADRIANPCLGGVPLLGPDQVPADAEPLFSDRTGYVQHLDVGLLSHWAEAHQGQVFVAALPGAFVAANRPMAWSVAQRGADRDALLEAFTVGEERSFDQDPRFCLSVLAEIAARALSPAVNDPGTAIDVIGRAVRILGLWENYTAPKTPTHPRVCVPPLATKDLFDDIFTTVARDGAGMIEVQLRLQKALGILAAIDCEGFAENARRHSEQALIQAEAKLPLESEKQSLRNLSRAICQDF